MSTKTKQRQASQKPDKFGENVRGIQPGGDRASPREVFLECKPRTVPLQLTATFSERCCADTCAFLRAKQKQVPGLYSQYVTVTSWRCRLFGKLQNAKIRTLDFPSRHAACLAATQRLPNLRKVIQVVALLLRKYSSRLNYTKLVKLLYIADREAISRWNVSITGDRYAATANGPILINISNLIKNTHPNQAMQIGWNTIFDYQGYDLVACVLTRDANARIPRKFPLCDELSDREEALLHEIDAKYHDWDAETLIKHVQEAGHFPEWSDPGTTTVPIHFEQILDALGRSKEEIVQILSDREAFENDMAVSPSRNIVQQSDSGKGT
jgi:hypothetical protein